jgi:diacylglycerol kinase
VPNGTILCHAVGVTAIVDKLVSEEHHLEEIARDGYAPATLPIVLGAIVAALTVIVGLALGVTLVVYYLS